MTLPDDFLPTWTEFRDAVASLFIFAIIMGIALASPFYADMLIALRDEIQSFWGK